MTILYLKFVLDKKLFRNYVPKNQVTLKISKIKYIKSKTN